ncbi:MAG: transglutaminase domain-containing protein [Deltaproteobacteria bacterium]|nr:transglutaminase domain-containing protein [Deltaproteobacteria bacterium]
MRPLVVWLGLAALAACAPPPPPATRSQRSPPRDQLRERAFTIWLGGGRIGSAVEREAWTADGVTLRRSETMRFLRGDVPVEIATTIEIAANARLEPTRVRWVEHAQVTRSAEARLDPSGWTVTGDGAHWVPPDGVPAELVPLVVRRDGAFTGRVFLPARGFLAGAGKIEPVAPGRLVARLELEGGTLAEATLDVDGDGEVVRVVDGDGVIALRATAAQVAEPFVPVDLIAATSVPITGGSTGGAAARRDRLLLDGDVVLPAVPGQATQASAGGLEVALSSRLPGALPAQTAGRDRTREIHALVEAVQLRIAPDLRTGPAAARAATSATAGDCTTFALAYAGLAAERSIPTRVITGYRVDGERLVRHRWATSWTGVTWIAVDAAFGAAPAGGDLLGLAVHDADDAGLVAGESALAQIRAASWR